MLQSGRQRAGRNLEAAYWHGHRERQARTAAPWHRPGLAGDRVARGRLGGARRRTVTLPDFLCIQVLVQVTARLGLGRAAPLALSSDVSTPGAQRPADRGEGRRTRSRARTPGPDYARPPNQP